MNREKKGEIVEALIEQERVKKVSEKMVQGDASETGVIRFAEGLLLETKGEGVEGERERNPIFRYSD